MVQWSANSLPAKKKKKQCTPKEMLVHILKLQEKLFQYSPLHTFVLAV